MTPEQDETRRSMQMLTIAIIWTVACIIILTWSFI